MIQHTVPTTASVLRDLKKLGIADTKGRDYYIDRLNRWLLQSKHEYYNIQDNGSTFLTDYQYDCLEKRLEICCKLFPALRPNNCVLDMVGGALK